MGRLDRRLGRAVQTALRVIYPARCLGCGGIVESDFGLCGSCWVDTPFISGMVCDGCGSPLPGGQEGEHALCDDCLAHPPAWDRGRAVMIYDGTGRRLVLGLKHGDRLDIAAPAALWLAEAAAPLLQPGMVVAPIPLHWRRRVRRGYNQSAELSRRLATHLPEALDIPDLLVRTRATPSLEGKGRAARAQILEGALAVARNRQAALQGRPVLLVDDVMTSGATLSAAAVACRDAGAVFVAVLALARRAKAP